MIVRRIKKKIPKLNLIPILDAVFIFIFFLLMSTQFIEIYKIGSEAPSISHIENEKNDDIPLNLILEINSDSIHILTGVPSTLYKKIETQNINDQIHELQKALYRIKRENESETTVRLRPHGNISYDDIVLIIDSARKVETSKIETEYDALKEDITLFNNIIFDNLI